MRMLSGLLLAVILSGCCAKTTLVLLPDDGEKSGVASLTAQGVEVVLDIPYQATSISGEGMAGPTPARAVDPDKINRQYSNIIAAQPPKAQSFILYFLSGSTSLTEASKAELAQVAEAAQQSGPVEIDIIGHSDTQGDAQSNYRLSLERAQVVEKLLLEVAPSLTRLSIVSHGENDLLIATEDNVSEPQNRRVEILIR